MVAGLTFFGLTLNTGGSGTSDYISFLLSGLIEIPAYVLCLIFLDKIGRRFMTVGFFLIGASACLVTAWLGKKKHIGTTR